MMKRIKVEATQRGWWGVWLSSGDDESRRCSLSMVGFGRFVTVALPPILRPYRERVTAQYWNAETIARLGRDWYWHTDRREFGVSLMDNHLNVRFGRQADDSSLDRSWGCFLPWAEWRPVRTTLYGLQGEAIWSSNGRDWDAERAAKERVPKARFEFVDYDGQRIVATTFIEEDEYRIGTKWCRWLSWFRAPKIRRSLRIDFSNEVGPEKGSWKGGTLGHGIAMLTGELHEAAFRRYCAQEHYSRGGHFRITFGAAVA